MDFKLVSDYKPMGDQPEAIAELVKAMKGGIRHNTLMGVTGSGKTFTIANVIAQLNRPTLVLSHNKTLAAQLYGEFKSFFPDNAVEYFVSYYDYYQPEAYLPTTDTYIEKDLSINDEIERLRLKTVATLLSGRRDVIVVSSVSCIYGCGNPDDFYKTAIDIKVGMSLPRTPFLRKLVTALYTRTRNELMPGTFRVTGETIDIMASFGEYGNQAFRISFFDDEVEAIYSIDPITGKKLNDLSSITLYPTNIFVTTQERINSAISEIYRDLGLQIAFFERENRPVEAQRIKQRVEYDLEMIKELGYCSGIENYSRYFDARPAGSRPFCLLDFFTRDFVTVIDESHVTIPQLHGMNGGDKARKENLVEYGFRLPAAKDNRPLTYNEFEALTPQKIYISATPGEREMLKCEGVVIEQVIRPTGVIDPPLKVRVSKHQIDNLLEEIDLAIRQKEKVLVTTITKRMAEEVSKYLNNIEIRNNYIHSDIDTLERIEILDRLRNDEIDVLVGVNLLREGIDLPEVGVVAILDADKEGFLRNQRSITQIAGRAARNTNGRVILYADNMTDSLRSAIEESNRRREKQIRYNLENGMIPRQIKKNKGAQSALISDIAVSKSVENMVATPIVEEHYKSNVAMEPMSSYSTTRGEKQAAGQGKSNDTKMGVIAGPKQDEKLDMAHLKAEIKAAKKSMEQAAKALDFSAAARHRDRMYELEALLKNLDKYCL